MPTPNQLRPKAASQSLNKTIYEREDIWSGTVRPAGDLRPVLYRLLRDHGEQVG